MQLIKTTVLIMSALSAALAVPAPGTTSNNELMERAHAEALAFLQARAEKGAEASAAAPPCFCNNKGELCCFYNWGNVCSDSSSC